MELFLFHPAQYQQLYNCTSVIYAQPILPMEKRQHKILGSIFLALFVLYEFLYIPCMRTIFKNLHLACYKFLFFIGLMDMANLVIAGFTTGILAILGADFCTFPTFIYIVGALGNAIFCAESTAQFILSVNRCLEIMSTPIAKKLFEGKRTFLWLAFVIVYAIFWLFKVNAILFNAAYFNWFFDPFIGYQQNDQQRKYEYNDFLNAGHDLLLIVVAMPSVYLVFIVAVFLKSKIHPGMSQITTISVTSIQKYIFIQVFLISFIHVCASLLYVYIQFVEPTRVLIIVNMFGWLHVHGAPPMIFLFLNRTIQKEFLADLKTFWNFVRRKNNFVNPSSAAVGAAWMSN